MMGSENKFWLSICGMVTIVLVCMIGSCTLGMQDKRDKWEKAVSNGADPMVASCAIFNKERMDEAACLLMSQNRK